MPAFSEPLTPYSYCAAAQPIQEADKMFLETDLQDNVNAMLHRLCRAAQSDAAAAQSDAAAAQPLSDG